MTTIPETTLIVALGDSTTAGTPAFLSPLEAPPDGHGNVESQYAHWLMRGHPGWRVLNRGVNGERSDQIRARFDRDVVAAKAKVVVVIAGVNDIYQGRPPDAVKTQLQSIYALAAAHAIPLVAGTILPYNTATPQQNARMREVNDWIRTVAADSRGRIAFVDTRAAVADGNDQDRLASSPDGLHPSVEGYKAMAAALAPAIVRLLHASPAH